MIHVVFRENGIATSSAEEAEKIAKVLVDAGYKGTILSYVEFSNPSQMLIFFKLLKLLEVFGDPNELEESLNKLKKDFEQLKDLYNKETSKPVIVEFNGSTTETSLDRLLSGFYFRGFSIKLEIKEEKIKLSFNSSS